MILFLHADNALAEFMPETNVNLSSEKDLFANGKLKAREKIKITCGETFSGNGYLDAPIITITAKKFDFTGTIQCDVECVITTREKFDSTMFTRRGEGKFIINIDPNYNFVPTETIKPRKIEICEETFEFKSQLAIDILDSIGNNNFEKFQKIVKDNHHILDDQKGLSILMVVAGYYNRMNFVNELIALGANVNSDDLTSHSYRPLAFALVLKNKVFVKILLAAGADPNISGDCWQFPLIIVAVSRSNLGCLIELLKSKNIYVI